MQAPAEGWPAFIGSIIAALLVGAFVIFGIKEVVFYKRGTTTTTASAKVKSGKTYNWVYQVVRVDLKDSEIMEYKGTYILKSKCEARAKNYDDTVWNFVCIRKQP